MKIKKILILWSLLFAVQQSLYAQVPEQEMRAVWLTSVSNLDWPKSTDRGNVQAQKADLIQMMDRFQEIGLNAVFFQIRPECDALYQSDLEPWSRFLTGVQGQDPGYDPLQFVIDEGHKRGMEVHAWMNPYRIASAKNPSDSYFAEGHVYKEHPDWAIKYSDGGYILNPGKPEVADYIAEVVADVVKRYDVDGIHFDDYFYAYGGTSDALDQAEFNKYAEVGMDRGDFRRASINSMVRKVYNAIKLEKDYVRFGISPFGIWSTSAAAASEYGVSLPSGIVGLDAYNAIYCDALAWMKEGTVDYVTPQQYWPTGGGQDYRTLNNWWADMAEKFNSHVYTGQGTYRLGNNPGARVTQEGDQDLHEMKSYMDLTEANNRVAATAAWTLGEIKTQVEINRANEAKGVKGSVYFRANDFWRVSGLSDYMKKEIYTAQSIVPSMINENPSWDGTEVTDIRMDLVEGYNAEVLTWTYPNAEAYRFLILETEDPQQTPSIEQHLVAVTYDTVHTQVNSAVPEGQKYVAIWAYDRKGFVQKSTSWTALETPDVPVITSGKDILIARDAVLEWEAASGATAYRMQISLQEDMSEILYSIDTLTATSFALEQLTLDGSTPYYWQLQSLSVSGASDFTEVHKFTIDAVKNPMLLSPVNNQRGLNPMLTVEWEAAEDATNLRIQIKDATASFEDTDNLVLNKEVDASTGMYTLENALNAYNYYDIRIQTLNDNSESLWVTHRFRTGYNYPAMVTVTSPENNIVLTDPVVAVAWQTDEYALRYLIEVSEDENFAEGVSSQAVNAPENSLELKNLKPNTTYYLRIAGENKDGNKGAWSTVVAFTTGDVVAGIEMFELGGITMYPNPASESVQVQLSSYSQKNVKWQLFDLTGAVVSGGDAKVSAKGLLNISLRQVKGGLYLLKLETTEGMYSGKLFVK
ncbi:family 10 glycosylhydrolase [Algivirga pacifica]|uniref:Fibronectin type-III domain-containing protein n=1 Tax=Algivirga pacifica TaxID=1162670 RepID=A0ABP9DC18_9BACT